MTRLVSETDIVLRDPARIARLLTERLASYELATRTDAGTIVADLGRGSGTLTVRPDRLGIRVEADDQGDLQWLRSVFASEIVAFAAGEEPAICWTASGEDTGSFANFREIRLVSAVDLTPRMRRLTFAGEDVSRFASDADLHVRLYFPPVGLAAPEWPVPGDDGRTVWPAAERRPAMRYYTIRRALPERSEIEIDFVLHPGGGPGAAFAADGRPGSRLGMQGPAGRTVAPASRYLLIGDETALPAIARICEGLPAGSTGDVLIEVEGPSDEIPFGYPAGMRVRWLHRGGAPAGSGDRLMPCIREASWPDREVFVWAGCESALARDLRRHFGAERGLPRDRQLIAAYWTGVRATRAA